MTGREEILRPFLDNSNYINKRVSEGVEKFRKGNAEICVKHNGMPVSGATVELNLKNHEFKHGANIFMLDEFEDEEDNQIYRERFADVFNMATLPFYWNGLEPTRGNPRYAKESPRRYRRPSVDLCLEYCEEKGITPKAHCLNYDSFAPDWVKTRPVSEIKALLKEHFEELADRYADKIHCWEVINETLFPSQATAFRYENDYVEWSFEKAREYFKNNELVINESHRNVFHGYKGTRSTYYMQIERALLKGASIDTIGLQFHMNEKREKELSISKKLYDPVFLYDLLDCYSGLGKKMQITEMTIPAYSDDTGDEEIQAEIMKNMYRIWFSCKNMEAVVYWNVADGYAVGQKGNMKTGENYYYGGFLRYDLSPKPVYNVIHDLFHKEWTTHLNGITDNNGMIRLNGFYGDYSIKIKKGSWELEKTITFCSQNENKIVVEI